MILRVSPTNYQLVFYTIFNMKNIFFLFIVISLIACSKAILGEDEPDTQINNFELFWNDFNEHYSLFTVRSTDWDAVYDTYRPQVTNDISDDELWVIFSNMIEELDDSHINLQNGNGRSYTSGDALSKQSELEISEELILNKYVDNTTIVTSESELIYGKIKDKNIGYIYLGSLNGENPAIIDDIVIELNTFDAIILDIRQNTGGEDRYSARIAQAFSDREQFVYTVQTRNGKNHDDFDEITEHFTQINEGFSYLKPVIVLTDKKTISAGEIFLSHMKAFDHVTQIGDTTAGDFSVVSNARFLPNNWFYFYSIQKFLLPNGESLDGIGHIPDIISKNTEKTIANQEDVVIETALAYLYNEFKIQ